MDDLRSKAIKVIPILAFLAAFTLSATRVRTAAMLPPCQEQTPSRATDARKSPAKNMEYNWQPEAAYARAGFADCPLRKAFGPEHFKLPEDIGWTVRSQRGNKDACEKNWEMQLNSNPAELLKLIDAKLAEGWTWISGDDDPESATSIWEFSDEDGKQWNAVAAVESENSGSHTFRLRIRLARNYFHSQSAGKLEGFFGPEILTLVSRLI